MGWRPLEGHAIPSGPTQSHHGLKRQVTTDSHPPGGGTWTTEKDDMLSHADIASFYLAHVSGAKREGPLIKASCPFCSSGGGDRSGTMVITLDPRGFFDGYFRCLNRCRPGGFPPHFGRLLGLDPRIVPGYDPDRESYVRGSPYPQRHINQEINKFRSLMESEQYRFLEESGVSKAVIDEMQIGYNGRYLVYPYFLENGNCYTARCVNPHMEEDHFWHGDEASFAEDSRIFNLPEIERCEDGTLFVTDDEKVSFVSENSDIRVSPFRRRQTWRPSLRSAWHL